MCFLAIMEAGWAVSMKRDPIIRELADSIEGCQMRDRRRFRRRLRRLKGRGDAKARTNGLKKLRGHIEESLDLVEKRRQLVPGELLTSDLPVLKAQHEIQQALQANQVIIVCGETGSGKTTQLPQIAMRAGRGIFGLIGHTQPRRLAARAVAQRIAEEIGPDGQEIVGFQVRFRKQVKDHALIKIMTDGILLSELATDPKLEQYDTIIVDEAHERSLNIDLLLGCLHQIVQKRPELRVIITSATIDSERFSEFFGGAPVIEVPGRQFEVEVIHAESGDSEDDPEVMASAVQEAMDQALVKHPREGDVLVFLPGEREIREVARVLHGPFGNEFEIVSLYARLSLAAQQKALKPQRRRRIVLATNVAETSLTVPRIRVVIDSGLVRVKRYSARRGIERLPVEGVSKASANQRTGRAGRVAEGTCYRLYSEGAFQKRDDFTAPEIMRTNLASVILRLADLGLGEVETFPLLDRPRPQAMRAGRETLWELGAIDEQSRLTGTGRSMARMPVDPRLARMLLAGQEHRCLADVLVIASGLAIPDPKIRPEGEEAVADQRHAAFRVEGSDLLSKRTLWEAWVERVRAGGTSSQRRWCQSNSLSWVRMREWREIHDQLHRMLREMGIHVSGRSSPAEAVHRALLSGLVTSVGKLARPSAQDGNAKFEKGMYDGPGRRRFKIHPSSGVRSIRPDWIMSAEIIETNRLWARSVAGIDPVWIAEAAPHLLEPEYGDPEWDAVRGSAVTTQRRMLAGLLLPGTRRVSYVVVDPMVARRIFIDEGLVRRDLQLEAGFFKRNGVLQEEIERREDRLRRRDLLVSEQERSRFYDSRLPDHVVDLQTLKSWLNTASDLELNALVMQESDLVRQDVEAPDDDFPTTLPIAGIACQVRYGFEPGADHDGLCIQVPVALLPRVDQERLQWLVPGLLKEKMEAIVRGLPKDIRRDCQPVAETVAWCLSDIPEGVAFLEYLSRRLTQRSGQDVSPGMIEAVTLDPHLLASIEVMDGERPMARGRDVQELLRECGGEATRRMADVVAEHPRSRSGLTSWEFDSILDPVNIELGGQSLSTWAALVDEGGTVGIQLVASPTEAVQRSRRGLCRLLLLATEGSIPFQLEHLPGHDQLVLLASTCLASDELRDGLSILAAELIFLQDGGAAKVTNVSIFDQLLSDHWGSISEGVMKALSMVQDLITRRQEIALQVESSPPPGAELVWEAERRHLDRLFATEVLHETPASWLAQYPRWLQVIARRLDRARRGIDVSPIELTEWEDRLIGVWSEQEIHPSVRQLSWLIEEWRVRCLSPDEPQAVKVTPETLQQQWSVVTRNG